jgi:hypothetical protein
MKKPNRRLSAGWLIGGPTCTLTLSPIEISPGGSATLTWMSGGASRATINGSPVALGGFMSVSPSVTTGYTLIVTDDAGNTTSAFVMLVVIQPPPSVGKVVTGPPPWPAARALIVAKKKPKKKA